MHLHTAKSKLHFIAEIHSWLGGHQDKAEWEGEVLSLARPDVRNMRVGES